MREKRKYLVDLTAHPYKDEESESEYVLVNFEEKKVESHELLDVAANQTENQMLGILEKELQRTKLHLQETIEQSEVSSEELKASN
ncbi:hypothetical protein D3C87_1975450 [compost metagenome]